jgi:NAD(P)-dependent dehydrogenase (short-subunit alcohol dehydrogenase family)
VIGEVADVTTAVVAALNAEGCRVRQVVPGSDSIQLSHERYQVDLSSPKALQLLQQWACPANEPNLAGVISFLGLEMSQKKSEHEDKDSALLVSGWTFHLVKTFADALQQSARQGSGWFINVTALDGQFGLGEAPLPSVAAAGTLGIVKTLHREYPQLRVKNIDVEPTIPADMLATRVLQELTATDDLLEVGLTRQGRWRVTQQEELIPGDSSPLPIDRESVILMTGGACGVTAAVARKLAEHFKPRLILVGRSPLPAAEPPPTCGLQQAALRKYFLDEARRCGEPILPAVIDRAVNRVIKDREIRSTLDACTEAGAIVEYHSLDVRDPEKFGQLLEDLYERFGRLDGVVHGAGILADRRIRDKTLGSFTEVFRTKADSAWTIARKLRGDSLKFLAFFGSVSGRLGNAGQVDYSAANEMLNKLADQLHRRWPGRVVCINWGPWQGGMVSDELRRLYSARGVELIPLDEGVAAFLAEIGRKDRRSAEVILSRRLGKA